MTAMLPPPRDDSSGRETPPSKPEDAWVLVVMALVVGAVVFVARAVQAGRFYGAGYR